MATSSSAAALEADDGSSSLSSAEQAALSADMFTLKCETGFFVAGLQQGEAAGAFVRVLCTLITVSVVSAWVARRDCINKLLLFFSHWLSGLLHQVVYLIGATMISVCWAGENLATFIKTLKFFELFASNMLAITNLAICVNLSLVVMSHVRSISTHKLVLLFLALSAGIAALAVPLWGSTLLSGTGFWEAGKDERDHQLVVISTFMVEFLVGICMLAIVSWLLLFRMTEIKECWKMHACLRYYFGLTLLGTVGNLALGVCGTIYVVGDMTRPLLIVVSWGFRQVRIALDTIVLHSVLATKSVDERAESPPSDAASSFSPTSPRGGSRKSRRRSNGGGSEGSTANDGVVLDGRSLRERPEDASRLSINRGLRTMAGLSAQSSSQSRDVRSTGGRVPVRSGEPRSGEPRSGEPPDEEATVWVWE